MIKTKAAFSRQSKLFENFKLLWLPG